MGRKNWHFNPCSKATIFGQRLDSKGTDPRGSVPGTVVISVRVAQIYMNDPAFANPLVPSSETSELGNLPSVVVVVAALIGDAAVQTVAVS